MLITALEKERKKMRAEMRAEVREEVRAESLAEGKSVGLIEGLQEGIILSLNAKFGEMALPLFPEIRQLHDIAFLQELMTIIIRSEQLAIIKDVIGRGKRTSGN